MMATAFSSSSRPDNILSPASRCVGEKRRRNEYAEICNIGNKNRRTSTANGDAEREEDSLHLKISECVALKFNDFGTMREQVNFAVGQTWALYDKLDGMPRSYARIRKGSAAPSFGLRITYLEPDPHDEKEIQWFEQDLPVSAGKFRLGKNKNTDDCCRFSHLMQSSEGNNDGHFVVSPRKGETWAVFKNWDINWSSDPDSHRKCEYEFVEVLSDYTDEAGVSVAFLHKAKGFASVFFRMGSTEADITQVLPQSLYWFSHRVPSFKMSGIKGKRVPKDAYELDQAALPQTIEEIIIPPHLLEESISKSVGVKFNDFGKLREAVNFAVGQTWALYDAMDGMPRLYAQIRKVSAPPSSGLRITNLEPLRYDGRELRWVQRNLPVSASKFKLGKNQDTKDHSKFSHIIQCNEESYTGHFTVFPQKGETWALFKNWETNEGSEPDPNRKYEYEFVEVLSDYDDKIGVYVASLHKAKGFASVYFRMGTGDATTFRILPYDLFRFSHQVPSFKITESEGKGVPKDAYELDQAAGPGTIEETSIPPHVLEETEIERMSKFQTIYFASQGKVFQTGQFWSFFSDSYDFPLYYGRIQKITCTQVLEQEPVYKLHINRLKSTPFPEDVIQYEDKKMPAGCGTFYGRKVLEIITVDNIVHQIVPQTSNDGKEYTILPKIGEVWLIYRFWHACNELEEVNYGCSYRIVEIVDDSLDYKVLLLEHEKIDGEDKYEDGYMLFKAVTEYRIFDIDGLEPIFTIPRSERLRFSHKAPASRVTKEIDGELIDLTKVDSKALPCNLW